MGRSAREKLIRTNSSNDKAILLKGVLTVGEISNKDKDE
jgi:ribosomal protein L2